MKFVWETPEEIDKALAQRLSRIRKRRNLSQQALSEKSNVSYGSIKRFETTGQISLNSLTKLCVALDCADEIKNLFTNVEYGSIEEVIRERTYSEEWLDNGFAISPFSLPVEQKVFVPTSQAFSGLWGVFADSLPDAWGQLLVDRMLKARGILSADMTQLERLAIVGDSGMGALAYRPAWNIQQDAAIDDLDELSAQCHAILNHEDAGDLDELFQMGGSSGGARPKIMTDEWIIKFPASDEMKDSGTMEKAYMDCAADCGIIVPETKLMPSDVCEGYFAVKRFDRRKTDGHIERQHMLTAAAILEVDWRTAAMDYHTLMKLTKILSLDNREDLEQMYRRMCFNVFAHNRDDHAKNFSWIYDEQMDCWHPSPAYDLTWSTTYFGEHSTTVDGNGRNPGMKELLAVGKAAGMNAKNCKMIAEEIWEKTRTLEATYRGWKS